MAEIEKLAFGRRPIWPPSSPLSCIIVIVVIVVIIVIVIVVVVVIVVIVAWRPPLLQPHPRHRLDGHCDDRCPGATPLLRRRRGGGRRR